MTIAFEEMKKVDTFTKMNNNNILQLTIDN